MGDIQEVIPYEELIAMKKEAYECNDARLLAVIRALESVYGDPYASCAILMQAFRMLARDQRSLMEKLVKALQCLPPSHSPILIKEPK